MDDHTATLENDLLINEWWYPVKKFGVELLFLLPLCWIFWWWGARSVRLGNTLQTLISSHLLVVATIPLIVCIFDAITSFIPKVILDKIWKWLLQYDVVGLWYYFLVFVGIGVVFIVIYLLQRRFADPARIKLDRLASGACYDCGKKLQGTYAACPFCGAKQYRECISCHQDTFVAARYCHECGYEESVVLTSNKTS